MTERLSVGIANHAQRDILGTFGFLLAHSRVPFIAADRAASGSTRRAAVLIDSSTKALVKYTH
jgi:hypothetical protein